MQIGKRTYKVDWGHLLVVTAVVVFSIGYLFDARATSLNIQNLLLVQPTALFVLLMYLIILRQCVTVSDDGPVAAAPAVAEEGAAAQADERQGLRRIAALVALFGVFVFTVEEIGYEHGCLQSSHSSSRSSWCSASRCWCRIP
jgi:hypothetical protein